MISVHKGIYTAFGSKSQFSNGITIYKDMILEIRFNLGDVEVTRELVAEYLDMWINKQQEIIQRLEEIEAEQERKKLTPQKIVIEQDEKHEKIKHLRCPACGFGMYAYNPDCSHILKYEKCYKCGQHLIWDLGGLENE